MLTESRDETSIRFEGFTLDVRRRSLVRGTERIRLTPMPFKVLEYLAQKPGIVISKEQLLDAVWGEQRDENTVEQAIGKIRRALSDEKEQPRFIQTIPGAGYCFIAETQGPAMTGLEVESSIPAESLKTALGARDRYRWFTWKAGVASLVAFGCLLFAISSMTSTPELTVANPTRITQSQTRILSPLLTDGARVYYPQFEGGQYSVAEVPARGGQSATAATGVSNPEICDLSSDGKTMLLRSLTHSRDEEAPVYTQRVSGAAQRVGNFLAYDVAWFPDAKHVLYSSGGVVFSSDLEGRSQQLFSVPGNAFWFRWAPGGKTLRFTVIDKTTEETSIWEVRADGQNPHRLFPEMKFHLCCGTWTPDGNFYLFQARVENTFQIWAHRVHHGFLSLINDHPFRLVFGAMNYRGPVVEQGGGKLFLRAESPKGELMQYDQKSGKFISTLPSIPARTLAFSGDGRWIAYSSLADNDLWRCHSDGADCLQLTRGYKQTLMPRWSPDDLTISFMGLGYSGPWQIFTVPANGGVVHPLTDGKQAKGDPDWSPDGHQLAFGDVLPVSSAGGISILDLRTNVVSNLPESANYYAPRWSPDGRSIVAIHAGDQNLYLFNCDSKQWVRLTDVSSGYPNWSHDGKYVYYQSAASNGRTVFRIAAADRKVEQVANLAGVERGPFFMSDWVGLAPGDEPLAINDSTTENIYSWDLIGR